MIRITKPAVGMFLFCSLINTSHAQTRFTDPDTTLTDVFWGTLYKDGGKTFFCDKAFKRKSILITEAYIYSSSWIRDHLRCGTHRQCLENNQDYRRMVSDLHNIVPADTRVEMERSNGRFEELPASVEASSCGLKRSFQIIEPANHIKGDIARTIFYMAETYSLPLLGDLTQLRNWHRMDPPDEAELERDRRISELQGNSNRFVRDVSAVNSFSR